MDQTFRVLSNRHRRNLLVALLDHDSQSDEPIRIPPDVDADERDELRFHTEMIHCHLPVVADAGLIRWQPETADVTIGPRFEEVRPLLELLTDHAADLPGEWIDPDIRELNRPKYGL